MKRGGGIIIYFKNSLLFDHVHGDLFNVSTMTLNYVQSVLNAHTLGAFISVLSTAPLLEMSKTVLILLITV